MGLGNPGKFAQKNYHNVGKLFIDFLEKKLGLEYLESSFGDILFYQNSEKKYIALVKSGCFMNTSGACFKKALKTFDISSMKDLIVVHDDLEGKFGKIRIKDGGSAEGHNGLKSIINYCGSQDFLRLKIGISRPTSRDKAVVAAYVLKNFTQEEQQKLDNEAFPQAIQMLETLSVL